MFKLGQKTSSRLLRGIFVSLLAWYVALISWTMVRIRSLFSCGSRAMRDLRFLTRALDAVGMPLKLGIARVDSDGGLRMGVVMFALGLEGSPG